MTATVTKTPELIEADELLNIVAPYEETGDPNSKTHIVNPPTNKHVPGWTPRWDGADVVYFARALGVEIVALCGYRFVPKQDPEKHDICMQCMKVAEQIMKEEGE